MSSQLQDPNRLEVYTETRKRRIFVGSLKYDSRTNVYSFDYDRKYMMSRSAIPIGPELPLKKPHHQSKKGELFPSFEDRIPSRQNPAYEEYCQAQGISPKERNKIVLLTTIGRRGPSTFVFEPIYSDGMTPEGLKAFRKELGISLRDISAVFDMPVPTIARVETGKSRDKNTMRLLEIYLKFPEVGLWCVHRSQKRIHHDTAQRLIDYFEDQINSKRTQLELPSR